MFSSNLTGTVLSGSVKPQMGIVVPQMGEVPRTRTPNAKNFLGLDSLYLGINSLPPLIGNPCSGVINPYRIGLMTIFYYMETMRLEVVGVFF